MVDRRDGGPTATALDATMTFGLAAFATALLLAMRASSPTAGGDPFDSPLYWWSWLLLPAVGCVASAIRPRPQLWAVALVAPLAVGVALLGAVWHDPADGASFWLLGELLVAVQGGVTVVAALAGRGPG